MQEPPRAKVFADIDPSTFDEYLQDLALFEGCAAPNDVRAVLREQIEKHVGAILELTPNADAFDLIELMRFRELSVGVPTAMLDAGSPLSVEIVTAVLLSRGARNLADVEHTDPDPARHIEELHDRAATLGRLATYRQQVEATLAGDPLAELTAEHQGAVLGIRNLHYEHIRDEHETALFSHPVVAPMMKELLGYSHTELGQVRAAIREIGANRLTTVRHDIGDILDDVEDIDDLSDETKATLEALYDAMMARPGERASFTPSDVAAESGLPLELVTSVMDLFSQKFDASVSASDRVFALLVGSNPFGQTPLVVDANGNSVATTNEIGVDSIRRLFETVVNNDQRMQKRYDQQGRQVVSEALALKHLGATLQTEPAYAGFHYFAPKAGHNGTELGPQCTNLNAVADDVEADGLFIVDDVALCIEVKGKSVSAAAARGDIRRLTNDLKATIRSGAHQALRLQQLIEQNHGFWDQKRNWVDLSHVREVRSVVAMLDDLGPVAVSIGDLQNAGLLPAEKPPWIVSLHDLAVIAEVTDLPSEFLLYIRRRADTDVAKRFKAMDELDLYMLFLTGELYVTTDPDAVKAAHPTSTRVRAHERREYLEDTADVFVGEQCGPLNAWVVTRNGAEQFRTPKPVLKVVDDIRALVEQITTNRGPGWFRGCADILCLSWDAQDDLAQKIRGRARLSRLDGRNHEVVLTLPGAWGYSTLFAASRPDSTHPAQARRRLEKYMRAKRHQLQADRAFGILVDQNTRFEGTVYVNDPVEDDIEGAALAAQGLLQPVGDDHIPIPPSGRRSTKRLQKPKRRR